MFEVFNSNTGLTVTYTATESEANTYCNNYSRLGFFLDYLPAPTGYYVLQNGKANGKRFDLMHDAYKHVDWENMASDYSTFTIKAHFNGG